MTGDADDTPAVRSASVSARPLTDGRTAKRMARQARRDTAPEVELRKVLHAAGLRFRVDAQLPGMPRRRADILFTKARIAVFVDGCFWHVCPIHATQPISNAEWWRSKLARNVLRDRETDDHLAAQGWTVLRFWEHEDMRSAAVQVAAVWGARRGASKAGD